MTVGDLIAELEEYDEDMEVMIGLQPEYPLVSHIQKVVRADDSEEDDIVEARGDKVYILEGKGDGYGNKDWWYL